MIYDNIDRGVYDLSNDKSGIRVGNEQIGTIGGSEIKQATPQGTTKLGGGIGQRKDQPS